MTIGSKLLAALRLPFRTAPKVGTTPADEIVRENKWRLLRYRGEPTHATPVLLIPSLINRHYVLDLGPERSFVEYLVGRGHDVYIVDWGTPGREDRLLTFDTFCDRYIGRAVRYAARTAGSDRVHLLGYCLGGTLTAIHTALRPERIASLACVAAPIAFSDDGLLSTWTRVPGFDVGALIDAFGNVPWPLMQASFQMLKPTQSASKLVAVVDRATDDEFLDGFFALERWGTDNVSFPGNCYRKYIEDLYRGNKLLSGELTISGERIDLANIDCPTIAVTFEHDHIVPEASASVLLDRISSADKVHDRVRGGHVGAMVSRKAANGVWRVLSDFWTERDAPPHRDRARSNPRRTPLRPHTTDARTP